MFEELKPLMANGERYIVVEGGRPEYVLMRFPDYVALVAGSRAASPSLERSPFDRDPFAVANAEIAEAVGRPPSGLPSVEVDPVGPGADPMSVRLEDLPL